ncbi:MAG: dienelactone hydrolase [Paracoccus sp. (in: a-proteobacteria)]|uniref:dienelactone hydrolase family protein n=1 Tax=Paracoccus sp. TaxID=267 RepID=UPI0039E3A23E
MRQWLIPPAAVLAAVLLLLALNTARNALGWQPLAQSPAQRQAMLAPHWRILRPPGPGPHKAAILLSGCDGVHDNMAFWAGLMLDQGRAAMILDSHAPHRLTVAQSWRAVCAGQILPGAERAGDLAVALAALRWMPGIDPGDVAILGASHGGWTVMELLAELARFAPPPGLTAWPAPRQELAGQIGPVVLLYPYCGLLNGGAAATWPRQARGLMILAQEDSITNPRPCREMAGDLRAKGSDLRDVTLAGVDHGFDQRERSSLSPLEFDAAARARATALVQDFLAGFASRPRPGI